MKKIANRKWFKYVVPPIGVAILFGVVFVMQVFIVDEDAPLDVDIRSYSTLSYCSDIADNSCQQNVSTLDVKLRTPNPTDVGINFLFMDIMFDEIRIEYYEDSPEAPDKATEEFKSDFTLYADANGNGVFDGVDGGDTRLSVSYSKNNILTFEQVDFTASLKWVKHKALDTTYTFFLVSEDTNDRFDHLKIDKLKVEAYDTRKAITLDNEIYSKTAAIDKSMWMYDDFISLSREGFLIENEIFIADPNNNTNIILPADNYEIKNTVVIPTDLNVIIEAGVSVRMDAGVSLISYSPVDVQGTKDKPVSFTRLTDEPWGVFGVIGNQGNFGEINISYAYFEGGYEKEINGAYLSGMVSLYRASKTTVANSTFENAYADDSLNVKYSEVDISNSAFNNNSADAFDGDFVSGLVINNTFDNNGNDSIDTSGSTIKIYNNYIYKSGDKCMSFGEGSDTIAVNNVLHECHIGVEVKDGSHPIIANNLFLENNIGYNSYLKKYFYDSPSTTLLNNLFINNVEQITFNNSFTGTILDTDNSTVTMKSNLFDGTYTLDQTRNLCTNCSSNMVNVNTDINNSFMWTQNVSMLPTITKDNLYAKYSGSSVRIGLIKSFWYDH